MHFLVGSARYVKSVARRPLRGGGSGEQRRDGRGGDGSRCEPSFSRDIVCVEVMAWGGGVGKERFYRYRHAVRAIRVE